MALWQIGDRPASVVGDPSTYANGGSNTTSGSPVIVYPNSDGSTGGTTYNYQAPNSNASDPYGGTPISINVGNSAAGLDSLSGVLGSGFSGLFDLIQNNTDKNNAFSAAQAQRQMDFQERMQNIAMDYNSLEAGKNREWQMMMSNSAHQREVADLKAAGLNPVLSASGGNGASVGSGATAAGVQGMSGAKADPDQSGNAALASIYGALINAQTQMQNATLSARTNLQMAEMQKEAAMYGAQVSANAAMYGASQAAQASMYGSDQAFKNNQMQREWNETHPQTTGQGFMWNFKDSGLGQSIDAFDNWLGNLFGNRKGSVSGKF